MTKDLKIPSKREQGELVRHAEREVFGMKFNRDITSIEYNSLNLRPKAVKIGCTSEKKEKSSLFSLLSTRFALSLPRQITFSDDTKMKLTYDAAGNKLRAEYWTIPTFNPGGPIGPAALGGGAEPQGGGIVGPILPPINQNDPQVVTDYCGNMIYRNDTLTMLLTEEGYVTFDERGEPPTSSGRRNWSAPCPLTNTTSARGGWIRSSGEGSRPWTRCARSTTA